MKLLYLKEHLSCINYQVAYNTGFVFCELRKEENSSIDNESSLCDFPFVWKVICRLWKQSYFFATKRNGDYTTTHP